MAQNDRNLYARQLHEAQNDWYILESIDAKKNFILANQGALIETEIG